jgi:hypothetical protein
MLGRTPFPGEGGAEIRQHGQPLFGQGAARPRLHLAGQLVELGDDMVEGVRLVVEVAVGGQRVVPCASALSMRAAV